MPEHYCQSCGMILTPNDCGTDAAGATTDHYCKWCYDHGKYTYDTTMEAMIEDCAPRLAQNTGMSLDEAVSLMGAVLPQLERWRTVQENEERYGAEARARYGDEAMSFIMSMPGVTSSRSQRLTAWRVTKSLAASCSWVR